VGLSHLTRGSTCSLAVRDRHADAHLGPVIVTEVGVLVEGFDVANRSGEAEGSDDGLVDAVAGLVMGGGTQ
jgi:hypothetical protein